MEPAYKLLSVAEFLDSCPNDERHYELLEGVIVAMPPPALPHQTIAATLAFELGGAVRANRPDCAVGSQGGIAPQGLSGRNYFEADIVVTCRFANDYRGINAEPLLIVEIQSPSTERDDHFRQIAAISGDPERSGNPLYRKRACRRDNLPPRGRRKLAGDRDRRPAGPAAPADDRSRHPARRNLPERAGSRRRFDRP